MAVARGIAVWNDSERASKMSALVVSGSRILGVGWNQHKTHPMQSRFCRNPDSIFKHAEIDAIADAVRRVGDVSGTTLYVYRVKKRGRRQSEWIDGLAEPCSGCMEAIDHYGIRRVVYSTDDGEFAELRTGDI
jgi:tRNA(Arg) A34 adenosine deaminase TadA